MGVRARGRVDQSESREGSSAAPHPLRIRLVRLLPAGREQQIVQVELAPSFAHDKLDVAVGVSALIAGRVLLLR